MHEHPSCVGSCLHDPAFCAVCQSHHVFPTGSLKTAIISTLPNARRRPQNEPNQKPGSLRGPNVLCRRGRRGPGPSTFPGVGVLPSTQMNNRKKLEGEPCCGSTRAPTTPRLGSPSRRRAGWGMWGQPLGCTLHLD